MEIKVNSHNSEIKHLVHGDIKFDYLPISGFAIFLTFFESTVSTYINLPLNPKTLDVVPTTDWHSDGLNRIPAVSCNFDNEFKVILETHSDYLVFCQFFGVEPLPLISDHFHLFNANALEA